MCWSPLYTSGERKFVYLVLGAKLKATIWMCPVPLKPPYIYNFSHVSTIDIDVANNVPPWITAVSWHDSCLALGTADGRVKICSILKLVLFINCDHY